MPTKIITRTTGGIRRILRRGSNKIASSLDCCCEDDPNKPDFGPWSPCSVCRNNKSPLEMQVTLPVFFCDDSWNAGRGCDDSFANPAAPPFPKTKYKTCCPPLAGTYVIPRGIIPTSCLHWNKAFPWTTYKSMPHSDGIIVDWTCNFSFVSNNFGISVFFIQDISLILNPDSRRYLYVFLSDGSNSYTMTTWRLDWGPLYDPTQLDGFARFDCQITGVSVPLYASNGFCRTTSPVIVGAV